jgi:PAS domain S-box-containing protein
MEVGPVAGGGSRTRDNDAAVVEELAGHLDGVFEAVPGGVYVYLDPTHKACNRRLAELLGTTVEEWQALESFRDTFVHVDDRQAYCDTYEQVVHGLDWPRSYRFTAQRRDGTAFDAEATIVPITFAGRKLAYHFVRAVERTVAEPIPPEQIVRSFQDAWNRHDVEAVLAHMTDDCVFESTAPAPDGQRVEGRGAMRDFWARFFTESPQAHIDIEELFAGGDRVTMRWRYRWDAGPDAHVRGVDVYRLAGGRIAEKLSYVKG